MGNVTARNHFLFWYVVVVVLPLASLLVQVVVRFLHEILAWQVQLATASYVAWFMETALLLLVKGWLHENSHTEIQMQNVSLLAE